MLLKRCPFCNAYDLTMDITIHTYQIRCLECGASGPFRTKINSTILAWNGEEEMYGYTSLINGLANNRNDKKELDL